MTAHRLQRGLLRSFLLFLQAEIQLAKGSRTTWLHCVETLVEVWNGRHDFSDLLALH